jgi:DnaJ-class molecular chaperone
MGREEQHKKEHYQMEKSESNKSETCEMCHGSGVVGDGTCSSCNGTGIL